MAYKLGVPLQELQSKTTSSEFLEWREYLKQEVNGFHREDWYFAQLAAEIRRSWVDKPSKVKNADFLITYSSKELPKQAEKVPTTAEEKKAHIQRSKEIWLTSIPGIRFNKIIKPRN